MIIVILVVTVLVMIRVRGHARTISIRIVAVVVVVVAAAAATVCSSSSSTSSSLSSSCRGLRAHGWVWGNDFTERPQDEAVARQSSSSLTSNRGGLQKRFEYLFVGEADTNSSGHLHRSSTFHSTSGKSQP